MDIIPLLPVVQKLKVSGSNRVKTKEVLIVLLNKGDILLTMS